MQVLKDDSLFIKELDKFIIQSRNESDYIIIDKQSNEVIDVLTQDKMKKLIPDSMLLNSKLKESMSIMAIRDLN